MYVIGIYMYVYNMQTYMFWETCIKNDFIDMTARKFEK